MNKYEGRFCCSRAINGISLNGDEFLKNDDDSLMVFDSVQDALTFLNIESNEIAYDVHGINIRPATEF